MKYNLTHKTSYKYFEIVNNYHSLVCLKPKDIVGQVCSDFRLDITPKPKEIIERKDYFGNTVHYFSVHVPHQELTVLAKSTVLSLPKSYQLFPTITVEECRNQLSDDRSLKIEFLQYTTSSPFVYWDDEIRAFALSCLSDKMVLYEGVQQLCHKIFSEFKFVSNVTSIYTPIKTVLKERRGVCQDFSHLAIACLRSVGLAARYVSGYIETLPPPGKEKLQGSDASHAWISVYIPGSGWCDFDPTNNMIPQERHIITAYGRDYSDVAPLKGVIFSSGGHQLSVSVDVTPI
ncbi:MAG: transglutaminase family protein [Flectobacillus sp.]|uniref:transglutaminase family protein n=1 Tax=Flectobacillus sp. TaxID=50419 RepID=UPI003B992302